MPDDCTSFSPELHASMIDTAGAFAEQLKKSQLVSPAQVSELIRSAGLKSSATSEELAAAAVRENLLTPFQAEELLNRRGRMLLINDYVLLDVLGYGGMGAVYLARHRERPEPVAIKLLGDQHKHDPGIRARFRLEARAGMQLDHPRLVKTYEHGRIEHLYGETDYAVMELVEGVTLLEGISFSAGPLRWDAACDVVCQAAEGLAYLHEQGMVHRDVKPDNILIDTTGAVKLLDFGLTLTDQQGCDEEYSLAMIFGQDCLGTADFIPPEQSIDSMNVDGRSDIYSLGCTLYVALAARRPFPRESRIATVRAHRSAPRPRVDEHNTRAPAELVDTVERMMAIRPEDRPASMTEVIALLSPYRRRRNWAFDFQKVLMRRRELKRALLTNSKVSSLQAGRPTKLNAHLKTDSPGRYEDDDRTDGEAPAVEAQD